MQKITRIGVVSFAKIMAVTAILFSFVVCIPMGLIMLLIGLVAGAGAGDGGGGALGGFAVGAGGAIFFMIGVPILYGVASFLVGLIYGLILNLVLSLAGGFELNIVQSDYRAG